MDTIDNILDTSLNNNVRTALANRKLRNNLKLIKIFGDMGSEVICVTNDDRVYCYGLNKDGCLGIGSTRQVWNDSVLNTCLSGKGLVDIVTGLNHCVGLTADGRCYCWGYNNYGHQGIDSATNSVAPELVSDLAHKKVVQVSCGSGHTLVLTSEHKVHSWGRNFFGQLGIGSFKYRYSPVAVAIQHKIIYICAGMQTSFALSDSGQVFVWGLNDKGQLGMNPHYVSRNLKGSPSQTKPLCLRISERLAFKSIVCGRNHTLLLSTDGQIFSFGDNQFGQIGNEQCGGHKYTPHRVNINAQFKEVISDKTTDLSLAISVDNTVFVWGLVNDDRINYPKAFHNPLNQSIFEIYWRLTDRGNMFRAIDVTEAKRHLKEMSANKERVIDSKDTTDGRHISSESENKNIVKEINNSKPIENQVSTNTEDIKKVFNGTDSQNIQITESSDSLELSSVDSISSDTSSAYWSCLTSPCRMRATASKFQSILSQSFDKQTVSDLKFVFTDGKTIFCHKTILQIRNKKFWTKCSQYIGNDCGRSHRPLDPSLIEVHRYDYKCFHAFLSYLYGLEPKLDHQVVTDVSILANIYEEPELTDLCQQLINSREEPDLQNVCTLYEKAINNDLKDLENFCIDFVARNWKTVCKSDAFQAMDEKLCEKLMAQIFKNK